MVITFQYTPFSDPTSQIRLLTIAPGPPNSPLHCSLSIVPLKPSPPPYIAISYTWGPPTPTAIITIDGHLVTVRQSCLNALATMRLQDLNTPVWIDALCINQTDTAEKSFQVGMMGSIYHSALWVAACLQCDDALATMQNLYPLLHEHDNNDIFESWQSAVYSILANPYFTRMWIVQEISLARDIRLFSSDPPSRDTLSWTDLEAQSHSWRGRMAARKRYPWKTTTIEDGDLERALKELADTRTEMGTRQDSPYPQRKGSLTLTGLMSSHLRRGCENPRDKIYAVLPMLEHAAGFDAGRTVVPDYGKGAMEVLREYVEAIRFPGELGKRNSIATGYELWTGLKTFESLVGAFRGHIPDGEVTSFLEDRRSRAAGRMGQPLPPLSNYLETHFIGLAMRITCGRSVNGETFHPTRRFVAFWSGLPSAIFTVGLDPPEVCTMEGPEVFQVTGYYPRSSELQLPERCDCRDRTCPGKRSKREMYVHPEDLLALVFHAHDKGADERLVGFSTPETRSFVRLWEPGQQQTERKSNTTSFASTMFAQLGRSIRRHV